MNLDSWLRGHAYLRPVARWCAEVDEALAGLGAPTARAPSWDDYLPEYVTGMPLLRSESAEPDLEPLRAEIGAEVAALIRELAVKPASGELFAEVRALAEAERGSQTSRRVVEWLLGDDDAEPASPGLMRYLGWRAAAQHLAPMLRAFAAWRDEDRWLRGHCPACGARPAMAQLIGVDPGRKRLLSCGCCGTRWRYKRTGCPFCEGDTPRLGVVQIEGESGLRIDYCETCRGYLKTYDGQGDEALLLADWTSLHLDVIAHDRGLKRLATSLFEIESALRA